MRACEASLGADVAPTSPGSGVPRGAGRPADLRPFLAGTGASSLHSAPIVMAFKHLQMQYPTEKVAKPNSFGRLHCTATPDRELSINH